MNRPSNPALLLLLAAAAVTCASCDIWSVLPTEPDPLYCDATDRPCTDPALPVCDLVAHECVARADAGLSCRTTVDCQDAARPLCEAGRCVPCAGVASDPICAARDANTPRCGASGACVACRKDSAAMDCKSPAAPACDDSGACRGCKSHDECGAGACLEGGTCLPAGTVYFVDNGGKPPAMCTMGDGSKKKPFCDIKDALAAMPARPTIVVAGSVEAYGAITITDREVMILGPGRDATPRATIAANGPRHGIGIDGMKTEVTIDGLEVTAATMLKAGVFCSPMGTATVTIRRSHLHKNDGGGVSGTNCTITLDRNTISANPGGGVSVTGGSYVITNNFIVANNGTTAPGVTLGGASTGTFMLNTVAKNLYGNGAGGVDCGNGSMKAIEFSIVWGNTQAMPTMSQFSGNCTVRQVVTGPDTIPMGLQSDPTFADLMKGDYHLSPEDPKNAACCIDQGMPPLDAPNRNHDIDGNMRPRGKGWDLGAHEAK